MSAEHPETAEEYRVYFYGLINRNPGLPAPDWQAKLVESGIPHGLPPNQVPSADMDFEGLTQQIGADGPRGRLFLPTGSPDDLGYYSHPYDLLADAANVNKSLNSLAEILRAEERGSLVWAWIDKGGPAVENPTRGGGGGELPTDLEARVATLETQVANLEARVAALESSEAGDAVKFGDKIALRVNSGFVMGMVNGGPSTLNAPVSIIGKDEIHAWESLTVEHGE